MTLYRCFAWDPGAGRDHLEEPDGPLWFPRIFQGEGRHDNPDVYGCLYLSDRAVSCIAERLAPFRGQRLIGSMLRRRGLPLALARLDLAGTAQLIDLDDPAVLRREGLRPSRIATRRRSVTQPQALALYHSHPQTAGLRWWSSWEALWTNVTIFDQSAGSLEVAEVTELTLDHPDLVEAAELFGLRLV